MLRMMLWKRHGSAEGHRGQAASSYGTSTASLRVRVPTARRVATPLDRAVRLSVAEAGARGAALLPARYGTVNLWRAVRWWAIESADGGDAWDSERRLG